MSDFSLIVAINNDSMIGVKEYGHHSIPWPIIKEDVDFFRNTTTRTQTDDECNAIIVGFNTWKTLPITYKINPKRSNIVISKTWNTDIPTNNEIYVHSLDDALKYTKTMKNLYEVFVIGGARVYHDALSRPCLKTIYLTHIKTSYPSFNHIEHAVYFPLNIQQFDNLVQDGMMKLISVPRNKHDVNKNISYCFYEYQIISKNFSDYYAVMDKKNPIVPMMRVIPSKLRLEEYQYLDLIKTIMKSGKIKQTRNSITKSVFGHQLKYDLSRGYPISTVKKSYPKAIFEELMWMLRGQTNTKILEEKGVNIWKKNSTREFLDNRGLSYSEGDIGPGYGFQIRHYGAEYIDCYQKYENQGVDQLKQCINLINEDPHSRRILIDLWNCKDIDKMALPPCHMLYNFGVDLYDNPTENGSRGKLNCHLFQRSWDVLLGWNTTTAALLTYILAHHCNLDPGMLVHSITDAHLYQIHIEPVIGSTCDSSEKVEPVVSSTCDLSEKVESGAIAKLLERHPRQPPKLSFLTKRENIEDYEFTDLVIENYYPCPPISADMVA